MPDTDDAPHNCKWMNQQSLHTDLRRGARAVMTAGSLAITGAQIGTGVSTIAVGAAVATGVAVSATGIGLVATGAALTLGGMALGARSAYSTNKHIDKLVALSMRGGPRGEAFSCRLLSADPELQGLHAVIKSDVLPYIIAQKRKKLGRKMTSAVGLGLFVGIYTGLRSLFKENKGKERFWNAEMLARHFITARCELAASVIAELYSFDNLSHPALFEMMLTDSDTLGVALMEKMKSI
ncbi:MAG: hypothetical protein JWO38_6682 [Gemmataceae bacterium]|nr:hypothetical protein [Gemmataceae bacterium]